MPPEPFYREDNIKINYKQIAVRVLRAVNWGGAGKSYSTVLQDKAAQLPNPSVSWASVGTSP